MTQIQQFRNLMKANGFKSQHEIIADNVSMPTRIMHAMTLGKDSFVKKL